MIVYKDKISGDAMFSDSYPMKETADGFFYEVEGKWVRVGDTDSDGAAEEEQPVVSAEDDDPYWVLDIVKEFGLAVTIVDKKTFLSSVKVSLQKYLCLLPTPEDWMHNVRPLLPKEQAAELNEKAQKGTKLLRPDFQRSHWHCWTGKSQAADASLVLSRDEGESKRHTFYFMRYGMDEVQC